MRVSTRYSAVLSACTQLVLLLSVGSSTASAAQLPRSSVQLTRGTAGDAAQLHSLQAASRQQIEPQPLIPASRDGCVPTSEIPTAGHNLTADELALLPHICWQPRLVPPTPQELPPVHRSHTDRGLPPGVDCEPTQWCGSFASDHTMPCTAGDMDMLTASHDRGKVMPYLPCPSSQLIP